MCGVPNLVLTSLGLTDSQMKPSFAPSAQIFPQNPFFQTIFQEYGQILSFFPAQNVAFMVLKTTGTISQSQHKHWFVNRPNITQVND